MFCPNCGAQIDDRAKFCSGCGAAVGAQPIVQQTVPPIQQAPPKDELRTIESEYGKRSEAYLSCSINPQQAAAVAEQILSDNGFKPKDYKGEAVWKKGTGAMTAMQFVKVAPFEDSLGIQAWTQAGIGDVGLKEMSLDGFVAALPKKSLLKTIEKIQNTI